MQFFFDILRFMEQSFDRNRKSDSDALSRGVKNTETQELFDPEKFPFKPSDILSLDGIYEHYKSTPENPKYYRVSGVTENTETGEYFVLYEPLYETNDKHRPARPLLMFTEEVEVDGRLRPRFRFVSYDAENIQ